MSKKLDINLKHEIERRLCKKYGADKNLIRKVRERTEFDDALKHTQLFNYREGGIPKLLLIGAAIGMEVKDELEPSNSDGFQNFFGVTFEEVHYKCDLIVGKDFPLFFDAEITVTYTNPVVNQKLGESVIMLQSTSDSNPKNKKSFKTDFEIMGKGIDLISGKPQITSVVTQQMKKVISEKAQVIHFFRINSKYNDQKRMIKTKKFGKNMFFAKHDGLTQVAGLKLIRPAKFLKLQLNFPKNIFNKGKYPKIQIIACEENTYYLDAIDSERTTSLLIPNPTCHIVAPGCYEWISQKNPLPNFYYTLSYTAEDIRRCL